MANKLEETNVHYLYRLEDIEFLIESNARKEHELERRTNKRTASEYESSKDETNKNRMMTWKSKTWKMRS